MTAPLTPTATRTITLFDADHPFRLESGQSLSPVSVAYESYGTLNSRGDNAVLVCHALTGSAHAGGFAADDPRSAGWWEPLIGPGRALNTDRTLVVCSNILGSCYGTTGPSSINPATGSPYALAFPHVTVRDMVRLQKALLDVLGVRSLHMVIGGSLGGMQVLEWAILYPECVRAIVPIGTAASHSPWCIGLNHVARQAIMNDASWHGGDYYASGQPAAGLSLARQIAMISYRSDLSFLNRFHREEVPHPSGQEPASGGVTFQVESYLSYQGEKLVKRFDAHSYIAITRAMDLHDVGRGRGTTEGALGLIRAHTLCIGISSDVLYPVHEQKSIAAAIPNACYREINSPHGHDAFLIEHAQMTALLEEFERLSDEQESSR